MTTFALNAFALRNLEIDPEVWSQEYVQHLVEQGAKVIVQRSTAGIDKEDQAAMNKAKDDMAKKVQAGILPKKGGGGGSRLTPEITAERNVVEDALHASFGYNKTEAKKVAMGGWFALFRHHVIQEATAEGMDVEEIDFKEAWDQEAKDGIKELYADEFKIQLAAAKGGEVKVKKTGFLKKS